MHQHEWHEQRRCYSPPPYPAKASGISEELTQQMIFGATTIELRCRGCGDIKTHIAIGNLTSGAA